MRLFHRLRGALLALASKAAHRAGTRRRAAAVLRRVRRTEAIGTLAVGLGTTAAMYAVVDAVLLKTALTIALLAGTGLVALRISTLLNVDFGFEHRGLHVAPLRPIGDDYQGEQLTRLYSSVIERLRERSGIQAALIDRTPLDFSSRQASA